MLGCLFIFEAKRAMGIFDEIGNDADDDPLVTLDLPRLSSGRSPWRALEGEALLRAERRGGSAALVQLGALAADLAHLCAAQRDAWALLNLDRIMRRVLAAGGLEPSDLLPHLVAGAPLPVGLGSDAAQGRFLLAALLPVVADGEGPRRGGGGRSANGGDAEREGVDGRMAARLLRRLRPFRLEEGDGGDWAEEQRAIDEVTAIARELGELVDGRMAAVDPLFAVTDLCATYGGALHGFPMDHLPDNSGATRGEMLLESFRHAASLPPALARARYAVPDGALIAVFDIAVAAGLCRHLPPVPPLTGLVRRDLFRRDLHYPADLGCLVVALRASLAAARRDLDLVKGWSEQLSRASARVQLLALTALTCFGPCRPSALADLAGSSWQGVESALLPLERVGVLGREQGVWILTKPVDREL